MFIALNESWSFDDDLSTDNTMILHNHKEKKTVFVHNGTNLPKRAGEDLVLRQLLDEKTTQLQTITNSEHLDFIFQ